MNGKPKICGRCLFFEISRVEDVVDVMKTVGTNSTTVKAIPE